MFAGAGTIIEGNDRRRPGFAFFWQHGLCEEILREYDARYADNPRVATSSPR